MEQRAEILKVHGAHNDFVLLDERPPRFSDYAALARRWCDRARGIGADGLLVVLPHENGVAATLRIYNADGSEAEMCGNGARCVARYLWERGDGEHMQIATQAGPVEARIVQRHEGGVLVAIDVGVPLLVRPYSDGAAVEALGTPWRYAEVSLGNPHIVLFVDDVETIDIARVGAALSGHRDFPRGTNVHVTHVRDAGALEVRHYERGVGVTRACGSGAVAAAIAAIDAGWAQSPVRVHVPGGTLEVAWERDGHATLTGPAEVEFSRTVTVA